MSVPEDTVRAIDGVLRSDSQLTMILPDQFENGIMSPGFFNQTREEEKTSNKSSDHGNNSTQEFYILKSANLPYNGLCGSYY